MAPGFAWPLRTGIQPQSMTWSGMRSLVILITTMATAMLGVAGSPGPVRPVVTLFFALTCPGISLVRLLSLEDPFAELTLGIATSVAVAGLVGGVLLYCGAWSPDGGLAILVGIAFGGLVGERVLARLGIARRAERSEPAESLGASSPARDRSALPRTLAPDLPPAPLAVVRRRSTSSPNAPKRARQGKRTPLGSDPLETPPLRRAAQRTMERAIDELAERRDEPQP